MGVSVLCILLVPALTVLIFVYGRQINSVGGQPIDVDKFLVVQTGVLTALAILVALGGTFITERPAWMKWSMIGALCSAIGWAGAILFTMITQQATTPKIDQKAKPWIPGITNAAWIAFVLLAVACVLSKAIPPESNAQSYTDQGQLLIAHKRLSLVATQADVLASWGAPIFKSDTELAYRTQSGTIVFCFQNPSSQSKSISEYAEIKENAFDTYCK